MKDIVIYGAGGFGREIACLLHEINHTKPENEKWNLIGFLDDGKPVGFKTEYGQVLGGFSYLNTFDGNLDVVMAIGNPNTLHYLTNQINNSNISFPNIIAPDIRYLDKDNMSLGKGNIFFSKCSLSCNVHIGDFNIFNSAIALGHDVSLGSYNVFMPGTKIAGEVYIGNCNVFGVYSIVLQQIKIDNNTKIAPASVIIRNTKNNTTYIGNPAKALNY